MNPNQLRKSDNGGKASILMNSQEPEEHFKFPNPPTLGHKSKSSHNNFLALYKAAQF